MTQQPETRSSLAGAIPRWHFHAKVIQQQCSKADWPAILEWLENAKHKPADLAFTAGPTRQVADAISGPLGCSAQLAEQAERGPVRVELDGPIPTEPGLYVCEFMHHGRTVRELANLDADDIADGVLSDARWSRPLKIS